ncbi:MAG: hypothetical protein Q8N69_03620 [bacterium]|nr:hypothetical protein [bacterium]
MDKNVVRIVFFVEGVEKPISVIVKRSLKFGMVSFLLQEVFGIEVNSDAPIEEEYVINRLPEEEVTV